MELNDNCDDHITLNLDIPITDFLNDLHSKNKTDLKEIKCDEIVVDSDLVYSYQEKKTESKNIFYQSKDFFFSSSTTLKKNIYRLISTFSITKKFITNLRNSTFYRNPKVLKEFHFTAINDKSCYSEGFITRENPSWLITMRELCGKLLNFVIVSKFLIIHPHNFLRISLDILVLLATCFYFIAIPIEFSFNVDFLEFIIGKLNNTGKHIIFSLFIMDMFLNLNTAILDKGELIIDRKAIMRKYISNQFIIDLLSLVYFIISNEADIYSFISFIFFVRLISVTNVINRIESSLFLDESTYNKISFLKLICTVFLFAHFSACLWHYIGNVNQSNEETWLSELGIINEDWIQRYIVSLYYVVVVMNTLGFGDIVPKNSTERIFNVFFIYIGCSVFAIIINSIGIILQNINKRDRDFKRKMYMINGYMRQKNIDFRIRSKIRNYFEYIWNEEKEANGEEIQQIINKLSVSLKNEMILSSHFEMLKNIPFFFMNFSEDTLNKISYEMKEVNFTPGEIIYNQNDTNDPCIYIIRNGNVEIFVNHEIKNEPLTILQSCKEGEIFGQISFINNEPQDTSARTTTFTTLYILNKKNFMKIIRKNDYDFQNYSQIKDQIIFSNNLENLYVKCQSCHNSDHSTKNCPIFHLQISKQRVIGKHNFTMFQERTQFSRGNFEKFHPLLKSKNLKEKAIFFQRNTIQEDLKKLEEEELTSLHDSDFEIMPIENHNNKISTNSLSIKDSKENLENLQLSMSDHISDKNIKIDSSDPPPQLKIINYDVESFEVAKEYNFYFNKNNVAEFVEKYNKISLRNMLKQISASRKDETFFQKRTRIKRMRTHFDSPLFKKMKKNILGKEISSSKLGELSGDYKKKKRISHKKRLIIKSGSKTKINSNKLNHISQKDI